MAKKAKGFGINFSSVKTVVAPPTTKEPAPVPMETDLTDEEATFEAQRQEELEIVRQRFRELAKKETAARIDYMGDNYYSCIVFTNSFQRQAFFEGMGMKIDKGVNLRFINGLKLAEMLDIPLPDNSKMPPEKFRVAREIMQLATLPKPSGKQTMRKRAK